MSGEIIAIISPLYSYYFPTHLLKPQLLFILFPHSPVEASTAIHQSHDYPNELMLQAIMHTPTIIYRANNRYHTQGYVHDGKNGLTSELNEN